MKYPYTLTPEDTAYAEEVIARFGLSTTVSLEQEQFFDYWLGGSKRPPKSWSRAWRNWIRNTARFFIRDHGADQFIHTTADLDLLRPDTPPLGTRTH